MINVRRYNPILKQKLSLIINANDPADLLRFLNSLNVADFRSACYILAEVLLPTIGSDKYWSFFSKIVPSNTKAFLGTFLKSAVSLKKKGCLTISIENITDFLSYATPIDKKKFLEALLPYINHIDELEMVVYNIFNKDVKQAVPYLINSGTTASYFILFRILKTLDWDETQLRACVISLMKCNRSNAFNMSSILIKYFDLKSVPGCFALHIEPYELSCLDQNFESFSKILNK